MAVTYDLEIEQGATFSRLFRWKDSEGVLVDLTGYTARMQIRRKFSSATAEYSATTENGAIVLGGALGTIQLTISATDTAALTCVSGVYDLELVDSEGVVTRFVQGNVTVSREVTR
jgi:hypothetical protein